VEGNFISIRHGKNAPIRDQTFEESEVNKGNETMGTRTKLYGVFTAKYGEQVQVRYSSGASCPQCWLSINSAVNKNEGLGGERIETEALLTVPMARLLIASLENFIDRETDDE